MSRRIVSAMQNLARSTARFDLIVPVFFSPFFFLPDSASSSEHKRMRPFPFSVFSSPLFSEDEFFSHSGGRSCERRRLCRRSFIDAMLVYTWIFSFVFSYFPCLPYGFFFFPDSIYNDGIIVFCSFFTKLAFIAIASSSSDSLFGLRLV